MRFGTRCRGRQLEAEPGEGWPRARDINRNSATLVDGATVFDHAMPHGPRRDRVEAVGLALSERPIKDVAQVEVPAQ